MIDNEKINEDFVCTLQITTNGDAQIVFENIEKGSHNKNLSILINSLKSKPDIDVDHIHRIIQEPNLRKYWVKYNYCKGRLDSAFQSLVDPKIVLIDTLDELKSSNNPVAKEQIIEDLLYYINAIIDAHSIKETYDFCESKKHIHVYSHRMRGWTEKGSVNKIV